MIEFFGKPIWSLLFKPTGNKDPITVKSLLWSAQGLADRTEWLKEKCAWLNGKIDGLLPVQRFSRPIETEVPQAVAGVRANGQVGQVGYSGIAGFYAAELGQTIIKPANVLEEIQYIPLPGYENGIFVEDGDVVQVMLDCIGQGDAGWGLEVWMNEEKYRTRLRVNAQPSIFSIPIERNEGKSDQISFHLKIVGNSYMDMRLYGIAVVIQRKKSIG